MGYRTTRGGSAAGGSAAGGSAAGGPAARVAAVAVGLAGAAGLGAATAPGHADDLWWLGGAGEWSDGSRWSAGRAPTLLDGVLFDHPDVARVMGEGAAGGLIASGPVWLHGSAHDSVRLSGDIDIAPASWLGTQGIGVALDGAAVDIAPSGALRLAPASAWSARDTVFDISGRLGARGASLIAAGRSAVRVATGGTLRAHAGTISPATLDIHGRAIVSGGALVGAGNGPLRLGASSQLIIRDGTVFGDLGIDALGSAIVLSGGGALDDRGFGTVLTASTLRARAGSQLAPVDAPALITLREGSVLTADTAGSIARLTLEGSTLRARGPIAFEPGGVFEQDAASTLAVSLGGGHEAGTLLNADLLRLDGTLRVLWAGDAVPAPGAEFDLFRAADLGYGPQWTIEGAFAEVRGPTLSGEVRWVLETRPDTLTLVAVPGPGPVVLAAAGCLGWARRARRASP